MHRSSGTRAPEAEHDIFIHLRCHGRLRYSELDGKYRRIHGSTQAEPTTVVTMAKLGNNISSDKWTRNIATAIFDTLCHYRISKVRAAVEQFSIIYNLEYELFEKRARALYEKEVAHGLMDVAIDPHGFYEWIKDRTNWETIKTICKEKKHDEFKHVCLKELLFRSDRTALTESKAKGVEVRDWRPGFFHLHLQSPLELKAHRNWIPAGFSDSVEELASPSGIPDVYLGFRPSPEHDFDTIRYHNRHPNNKKSTTCEWHVADMTPAPSSTPPDWLRKLVNYQSVGSNKENAPHASGNVLLSELLDGFRANMTVPPGARICVILETCLSPLPQGKNETLADAKARAKAKAKAEAKTEAKTEAKAEAKAEAQAKAKAEAKAKYKKYVIR